MTGRRLPPLPLEEWSDADRELIVEWFPRARRFVSVAPDSPPLPDILGLYAHHPQLTSRWLGYCGLLLDGARIEPRDRELLILRVAWRTRSSYEWAEHVKIGRAVGLPDDLLQSAAQDDLSGLAERDRLLLAAVDQMIERHDLTDDTWAGLAEHFDRQQLLELLFIVGTYLCLAVVMNSAGLHNHIVDWADPVRKEGEDGPLAEAR